MTTDWSTRISRGFTTGELRSATRVALGELLGVDASALSLAVVWSVGLASAHPGRVPDVAAEVLARPSGPDEDVAFVAWDLDAAAVEVNVIVLGDPDEGDEHGGVRLHAAPYRAAHSCVLAIATAITAACLGGSPVWDERTTLSDRRVADPECLVERLRQPPGKSAWDAALDLLRGTGLRDAADPDW
ncbi:hypothetical protein AB0I60_36340 [Actinosynnema sp. NPDC050436]|uniref:hypothetical protein n=1 Tax=Actinosynnema sp. NPDC050436 TaxID=3155659 RepID=UPI0033D3A084